MLHLLLTDVDFKFDTRKITWRGDVISKTMLTVKKVELIDKHKFFKTAPNKNFPIL